MRRHDLVMHTVGRWFDAVVLMVAAAGEIRVRT